MINKIVLGDI